MKIGILGGTFDPIHIGHLVAAEWTREEQGLDQVWFMPSAAPPHKNKNREATPHQRLDMVKLAIEGNPYFNVTDIEIVQGGISYSYDSIIRLKQLYPQHQFYFIIGADMVQYLPHWHNIDMLIDEISFIGLKRPGVHMDVQQLPEHIRNAVQMSPMPFMDISSSTIRERRSRQRSIRFLVPDSVEQYIKENRLYEQ